MRFWVALFAPLFASLTLVFASPPTAVTENDPSTLVDGVSVITGDFYLGEEDYVVAGAEPIPLRRFYLSAVGGINQYPHLTATFALGVNKLFVPEPNGTQIFYLADPTNPPRGEIGKEFYGKKKQPFRYHSFHFANSSPGVTNTSTGVISAQSQLKNQTIVFDPGNDAKGKSFTLYTSDGTVRRYFSHAHQEKADLGPRGEGYVAYYYKLVSETLPNGRVLHYEWDSENSLIGMRTSNPSNSKTLAKIPFPKFDLKKSGQSFSLSGSDGRNLTHIYRITGKKNFELAQVISPERADQHFGYSSGRLSQISLPDGRAIAVQYDGSKVSHLLAPIGPNGSLIPYYKFTYDEGTKTSRCVDALQNTTIYHWNGDYRLTRIERFEGERTSKNSEIFVWEGTNLRCKVFYDDSGAPLFAKTFSYDAKGNVLEEIFWGNLSGKGPPLRIDAHGMPADDGVEKAIVKNAYEARNLLVRREESSGLVTEYTYLPYAQLPSSKTLSASGRVFSRTDYAYDSDNTLMREMIQEGAGVYKIQEIVPRRSEPYIGLPDQILEKYRENGIEKLLRSTKLHYTAGALVSQKDIYDSDHTLRYSLHYKYDAKGRILEETNAIGQKWLSSYDEVGNKVYFKDFSGRQETLFYYDLANRLVKKIERGFDGIEQEYIYNYDAKHNLISETDAYGNATLYEYDLNGQKTKIISPLQQMRNGIAQNPIVAVRYDSMSNPIVRIDAEGHDTRTAYTVLGKPTRTIHPDGAVEENIYNLDGTLALRIDPLGVKTHYKYDAQGRIIEKRIDDAVETFVYDGRYLIETVDPEGTQTLYRYDGAGRKIAEETTGEIVAFTYDPLGRLASRIEGELITSFLYDPLDRLVEEKKWSNAGVLLQVTQYEYDNGGNQSTVIRGKSSVERFEYDSLNRQIRNTDPLGAIETTRYEIVQNSFGQRVLQTTKTDPMGLETIEIFDAQHRPTLLEKRKNKSLLIENVYHDLNGQKTAQEEKIYHPDGSYRTILNEWTRDARGRPIVLIEGNGSKVTRYEYNLRGDKIALIKPDGTILSYEYNHLGHLTRLCSSDGTVDHRLEVDRLGRPLRFDGITRTLDARGQILEERFPSGSFISHRYDSRGRKVECSIPLFGLKVEYQHGPLDLEKVTMQDHTHAYTTYDLAGNLLEETLIDGSTLSHSYDPAQRSLSIQNPQFTQSILEYDAVGNILRMNVDRLDQTYTYDALYQLTSEMGPVCHSYTFDGLYNRLSKDAEQYVFNALNQPISHCTYDLNGNLTQMQSTRLFYDALDRLIRVETSCNIQTFAYDYLNRCLSRTVQYQEPLFFLYDGQNEIGSFDGKLRDFRVLGRTETAEIGAAVATLIGNSLYAPIHDLQGNIAALISIDSTSTSKYRYSAFGEERLEGVALSPWRFSSKRVDPLTCLVNYGRRFYLPSMGCWLTPDPLGFSAGMNLYAFVHNDPLTHLDEYGLYPLVCKPYQEPPEWMKRFGVAAMHEASDQCLGAGRFLASSPCYIERGYNYLTGRQNGTLSEWYERQNQFFDRAQDWMYRAFPTDRTHPDYLTYRRGLEIGSYFVGTYGLLRGGVKVAKWGANAWRFKQGTYVAGQKLARSTTNAPLNRFHQTAGQLSETGQNNIRVLRGWAKSKGWERLPNPQGRPEIWGTYQSGEFKWNLKIKPEPSFHPNLDVGSRIPRFDAKLRGGGQHYINPFTGQVGIKEVGTHVPLDWSYY